MNYEIVNEELKIASISLADLTFEKTQEILKQWDNGAKIGTLSFFFHPSDGWLYLNRDNKQYKVYLNLVEAYLGGDYEIRKKMMKSFSKNHYEEMRVLEKCVQHRAFNTRAFYAINNRITKMEKRYLEMLIEKYSFIQAIHIAYKSGVIKGKRIERAKRKRGTAA